MKQIVQSVSNGELKIVQVPQPQPGPTEVLVATRRSLLSAGTERAVRQLASANLLQKAKARPDLVRKVLARARSEGVRSTVASVRTRLDDEMPLGYSGAGLVVSVGEYVENVRPGMRVATASAGHADYQVVPGLLAVPLPENVSDQAGAFGAVAAIALQGLRQADVGVGGTVCVIGLGLVGQLTVRLALAAGLRVVGIDLRDWTATLASSSGALGLTESGTQTTDRVRDFTRGRGVDAVLITAATASSEPVRRATELCRDRGRLVVVGDVGLELDRRPFYEGELEIRFARSYGPGRYDRSYEEWGVDYPIGQVRWTEARNIEAYLDLLQQGRLDVDDLVTNVFDIDDAAAAYAAMESDSRSLAVQLSYAAPAQLTRGTDARRPRRTSPTPRAGIIGAGNYARATFLPAMKRTGWADSVVAVTSSKGLSARHLAERYDIGLVLPTAESLINQSDLDIVFILSGHDSHASLVVQALDAGKHVFVEKPMALTEEEGAAISAAYDRNEGHLFVGYNRRHSEVTARVREILSPAPGPFTINYRVNAGKLPDSHWYGDRRQGGRLAGEVCHFVDLVGWVTEMRPTGVFATSSGRGPTLLDQDLGILLGHSDGSIATVTYSTQGNPATSKERLEILSGNNTVVVDDFKSLVVNNKPVRDVRTTKGHDELLRLVRSELSSPKSFDKSYQASLETQRTMMSVARCLTMQDEGAS